MTLTGCKNAIMSKTAIGAMKRVAESGWWCVHVWMMGWLSSPQIWLSTCARDIPDKSYVWLQGTGKLWVILGFGEKFFRSPSPLRAHWCGVGWTTRLKSGFSVGDEFKWIRGTCYTIPLFTGIWYIYAIFGLVQQHQDSDLSAWSLHPVRTSTFSSPW